VTACGSGVAKAPEPHATEQYPGRVLAARAAGRPACVGHRATAFRQLARRVRPDL